MNVAIVVAAGKGTRLGGNRPKQFLELDGIPVIIHTLRQFERCPEINEIVIVLPAGETDTFLSFAHEFGLQKLTRAVAGGETRAQSVQNGLAAIDEAEMVAVHDGVRPFVTPDEIGKVIRAARATGAAILVAPVPDTIKQIDASHVSASLPRANLRRALTPQCFRLDILKRAYDSLSEVEGAGGEATDDSVLVERLGIKITIVEGSPRNIKITQEEDLVLAEAILSSLG